MGKRLVVDSVVQSQMLNRSSSDDNIIKEYVRQYAGQTVNDTLERVSINTANVPLMRRDEFESFHKHIEEVAPEKDEQCYWEVQGTKIPISRKDLIVLKALILEQVSKSQPYTEAVSAVFMQTAMQAVEGKSEYLYDNSKLSSDLAKIIFDRYVIEVKKQLGQKVKGQVIEYEKGERITSMEDFVKVTVLPYEETSDVQASVVEFIVDREQHCVLDTASEDIVSFIKDNAELIDSSDLKLYATVKALRCRLEIKFTGTNMSDRLYKALELILLYALQCAADVIVSKGGANCKDICITEEDRVATVIAGKALEEAFDVRKFVDVKLNTEVLV